MSSLIQSWKHLESLGLLDTILVYDKINQGHNYCVLGFKYPMVFIDLKVMFVLS